MKHVIRPAVELCGYEAKRADELDKPGIITSQIIQHIIDDPLVVADLTERNPNVFYELAIRHAIRKPLVQLIKKGETIPFDVAGMRTISVDHQDLDSVANAKDEITRQVKELEKTPDTMETPISASIELKTLRQSDKPEERSLAELLAVVSDLRASLGKVEVKIGTKDQQGALDEILKRVEILPRVLEEYIGPPRSSMFRRGMIHPMMFREFSHIVSDGAPEIEILLLASFFKDIAPWVYEIGVDAYRRIGQGDTQEIHKSLRNFQRIIEVTMHGPMSREILGRNKEIFMLLEEMEPMLMRLMDRIGLEGRLSKNRTHKEKR